MSTKGWPVHSDKKAHPNHNGTDAPKHDALFYIHYNYSGAPC